MIPAEWSRLVGLAWTLVRTDFKVRYHGTIGGFVWALLKPVLMFLVLMAVFSLVFHSTPDYKLDLILGLFLWDFFSEGTRVGLISLHQKGYLLTKARFPAWLVVVTSAANALVTISAFSLAIGVGLALVGRTPTAVGGALFLVYLLAQLLIVIGFSLAASVLFLRFRDLNQVWEVLTQAGFFLAPIIWPIAVLPERLHAWLYLWWPTPIIQFSREVLVHGARPSARAHGMLAIMTAVTLGIGVMVYRRFGPASAEHV